MAALGSLFAMSTEFRSNLIIRGYSMRLPLRIIADAAWSSASDMNWPTVRLSGNIRLPLLLGTSLGFRYTLQGVFFALME